MNRRIPDRHHGKQGPERNTHPGVASLPKGIVPLKNLRTRQTKVLATLFGAQVNTIWLHGPLGARCQATDLSETQAVVTVPNKPKLVQGLEE